MKQERIFIAADASEQETLEAGIYTILKRWESQQLTEENYRAMQTEVYNFCRYWFIKNGRPVVTAKIKEINIKCEIPEKAFLNPRKFKMANKLKEYSGDAIWASVEYDEPKCFLTKNFI